MHRARPLLLAVPFLLAVAACGDSGGDPTVAEDSATTVASTAPPTSTTLPPPVPQATAEDAINALLDAWQNGDRAAALTVADASAVDALFSVDPEPAQARGCNSPDVNPNITCVYRLAAGELQARAVPRDGGYVVDFVILGGV